MCQILRSQKRLQDLYVLSAGLLPEAGRGAESHIHGQNVLGVAMALHRGGLMMLSAILYMSSHLPQRQEFSNAVLDL